MLRKARRTTRRRPPRTSQAEGARADGGEDTGGVVGTDGLEGLGLEPEGCAVLVIVGGAHIGRRLSPLDEVVRDEPAEASACGAVATAPTWIGLQL